MSDLKDFFQKNKDRYQEDPKTNHPNQQNAVHQNLQNLPILFTLNNGTQTIGFIENSSIENSITYDNYQNFKWKQTYKDKSLQKFEVPALKQSIPDKVATKNAIIQEFGTITILTEKTSKKDNPLNIAFVGLHLLASIQFIKNKNEKFIKITGVHSEETSLHTSLFKNRSMPKDRISTRNLDLLLFFERKVFQSCANRFLRQGNNECYMGDICNEKIFLRALGELILEHALNLNFINKNQHNTLKNTFNLILNSKDNGQDGFDFYATSNLFHYLIPTLILHINYPLYIQLLNQCYNKNEILTHWNKLIKSCRQKALNCEISYENLIPENFRNLLNHNNLDDITLKITGHPNKSKLKIAIKEILYRQDFQTLNMIYTCQKYIERDWIIEIYNNNLIAQDSYIFYSCEKLLENYDQIQLHLKFFMQEYLTNKKLKRDFFLNFIMAQDEEPQVMPDGTIQRNDGGFTYQIRKDLVRMYYELPKNKRPKNIPILKLHDK